ncbi:aspartate aminotransferase family protein [Palleronia sp. LCG004]|uniref:aminotransferase family protein n=1 Tax=Palleronia sp. LCG004 TaxID=3079304 RepID=UPI00294285EB|nr:aminotransferase class III-fold pyridoxal phosphate-dependent enzyme [Palleronia sp. LCG004]WOI57838.1 aminotransferase class III-fold pyridoxal phosphate-dependent enzyme [Palleronia sp. LCG004]
MSALLKVQVNKRHKVVDRGKGVWLWDTEGKDYIDGSSGAMAANIGHGVEEVADAMSAQARKVAFAFTNQFTNAPAEELARRLADLAPGDLSQVFFVNSGSEASEHALRLSLQYWREQGRPGKTRFISRERSYHGMTMGALSLSGHDGRRADYGAYLHKMPGVPAAYAYRSDWGTLDPGAQGEAAARDWDRAILEAGAENVAAVILEPIVGAAGGALVPPEGYLRHVREICDRHDVLMIADEVITGMGRTGDWFACGHEGIVPDILTTAKGLSAGYAPMGAVILREHVAEALRTGSGASPYGHTFSGNPLGAATCLAVLDFMERHDVLGNVAARGREIEDGLRALAQRYPHMADVRGRGLLWGFEFVMDRETRTPPPAGFNATGRFVEACWEEGLVIYPAGVAPLNNACLVSPPLVITAEEVEELLARLDRALRVMETALADLADAVPS